MLAPKPKKLRAVRANAGIRADYERRLRRAVQKMHDSVTYWLAAAYRTDPPILSQDASPAATLQAAVRKLATRWQKNWNAAAPRLARYFATQVHQRSDGTLKKILKDAGISVDFKMTPAMQDVFTATVKANVSLIKSIPQKYFQQVEGIVMRSVQAGRDLGSATREIEKQYKLAHRRAALIARDQNNKASSALQAARQRELGMEEGEWLHSGRTRNFRPTHVAMSGKRFRLDTGMWDPAVKMHVMPGWLINCACTWRPVIPGM